MSRFFSLLIFALLALTMTSCRSKAISVEEVLQQPASSKVYTQYNMFYEDPMNISAINYQKGNIIPLGTEVKILEARGEYIKFKIAGQETVYNINFPKERMMIPLEDYIKHLFGAKNEDDLSKDVKPVVFEKIKRGIVEDGMTRNEVLMAYGYPVAHRTPSLKEDTWIYWSAEMDTKRVVFKGEKVISVFKIE